MRRCFFYLFSIQCEISCNLTKFRENRPKMLHFCKNIREPHQILFFPNQQICSNCFYNTGKHIFPIQISCKQIFREQLPKSHFIKIFSQKIVPVFHMLLTSFAFFLRNLGKSQLFLIFTKIFATIDHMFAREPLQRLRYKFQVASS